MLWSILTMFMILRWLLSRGDWMALKTWRDLLVRATALLLRTGRFLPNIWLLSLWPSWVCLVRNRLLLARLTTLSIG